MLPTPQCAPYERLLRVEFRFAGESGMTHSAYAHLSEQRQKLLVASRDFVAAVVYPCVGLKLHEIE